MMTFRKHSVNRLCMRGLSSMSDDNERALENFTRAMAALQRSVSTPIAEPRDLSGIIKDFEIAYELGWKCLKRALGTHGIESGSARETFERAYQSGWIDEEEVWLAMISDRNQTVHTYNEKFARALVERVNGYHAALEQLLA